MTDSWSIAAPALERLGYCVFALDYGNGALAGVNGVGDIPRSARQLSTFVARVRAATGAAKVSIVGHSQGGMMPRYYAKLLGGAARIDDLVGLSPSSHGTTIPLAGPSGIFCPACAQQVAGSDFMRTLNAGDETPPAVSYSVIETRNDEVVTPYQSEFLPATPDGRVRNVLLQDACPGDLTDHVGIVGDPVALEWMLNALGRPGSPDAAFRPDCTGASLATFPDSSSARGSRSPAGRGRHARLALGRIGGSARRTRHHRLRVRVFSNRVPVRARVVVRARRASGRTVGRSGSFRVSRSRAVTVRLRRALRRGRYVAVVAGRDRTGRRARAVRSFRLG